MQKPLVSGTSLIEVLVSLIILSVGLLGVAGMQLNAIRFNNSAQLRSVAVTQVNNMMDRMYANKVGVRSGGYNNIQGDPGKPGCVTCAPGQIAQLDAHEWNFNNATLLPQGLGIVQANGASRFRITLRWDGSRTGAQGTGCSGNNKVDLSCIIVEVEI